MKEHTLDKRWRNLCWLMLALAMAGLMAASAGSAMGAEGRGWLLGGTLVLIGAIAALIVCGRKLRCPACGRIVDREAVQAFGKTQISCPQCGRKLTLK